MESVLTVVTAATTQDLTILETAKDELGITDSSTDTLMSRWISESSAQIAAYTNRVFGQETVLETFRQPYIPHSSFHLMRYHSIAHSREGALALRRFPIASVTSVIEDNAVEDDGITPLTVDPSDYEIDPTAGLLWRLLCDHPSFWYAGKIAVTYVGGYDLPTTVDLRLQQACLLLLKHRWAARGRDPMLRQVSIPGIIERQYWVGSPGASDMPPEAASLLESFRERVV